MQFNTFDSNFAGTKGGAVSWNKVEPQNLQTSNTFVNNTAGIYGDNIGSVGESISIISKELYNVNVNTSGDISFNNQNIEPNVAKNHQSGAVVEPVHIAVYDRYGNIVKYGNKNNIEVSIGISASEKFSTSIVGTTSYALSNGVTVLNNLVLTSTPSTTQTLKIRSSDILDTSQDLEYKVELRA
jgi:hypothetical protein